MAGWIWKGALLVIGLAVLTLTGVGAALLQLAPVELAAPPPILYVTATPKPTIKFDATLRLIDQRTSPTLRPTPGAQPIAPVSPRPPIGSLMPPGATPNTKPGAHPAFDPSHACTDCHIQHQGPASGSPVPTQK